MNYFDNIFNEDTSVDVEAVMTPEDYMIESMQEEFDIYSNLSSFMVEADINEHRMMASNESYDMDAFTEGMLSKAKNYATKAGSFIHRSLQKLLGLLHRTFARVVARFGKWRDYETRCPKALAKITSKTGIVKSYKNIGDAKNILTKMAEKLKTEVNDSSLEKSVNSSPKMQDIYDSFMNELGDKVSLDASEIGKPWEVIGAISELSESGMKYINDSAESGKKLYEEKLKSAEENKDGNTQVILRSFMKFKNSLSAKALAFSKVLSQVVTNAVKACRAILSKADKEEGSKTESFFYDLSFDDNDNYSESWLDNDVDNYSFEEDSDYDEDDDLFEEGVKETGKKIFDKIGDAADGVASSIKKKYHKNKKRFSSQEDTEDLLNFDDIL